jgi:hypothetical protein
VFSNDAIRSTSGPAIELMPLPILSSIDAAAVILMAPSREGGDDAGAGAGAGFDAEVGLVHDSNTACHAKSIDVVVVPIVVPPSSWAAKPSSFALPQFVSTSTPRREREQDLHWLVEEGNLDFMAQLEAKTKKPLTT